MKINVRLLLITFILVVLVSSTSTFIYHSITNKLLETQLSRGVLNSVNDYNYVFNNELRNTDDDFQKILISQKNNVEIDIDTTCIDYFFSVKNDSIINPELFIIKSGFDINPVLLTIYDFIEDNPRIILRSNTIDGVTYYYGKIINEKLLTEYSKKIRADIAFVINNEVVLFSNSLSNEKYLSTLKNSLTEINHTASNEFYRKSLDNADFFASYFKPNNIINTQKEFGFIIFNASVEAQNIRSTMQMVLAVITASGIALSLVLVLFLTTRLRKQISLLSEAAEKTGKGDFESRVTIISKDEIGKLGEAFNEMLDELERRDESKNEYTEFISLLNHNPSLNEISTAVISKIIKTTELKLGALYLVEDDDKLRSVSSFGVDKDYLKSSADATYFKNAIDKKEIIEFSFNENFPVVNTGLVKIEIRYLMIVPIIYNKNVIAILELASDKNIIDNTIKQYLENIHQQLAVGLTNAIALEKLENLVHDLKVLNEEYEKQNTQITQQNQELIELHNQLLEKTEELEDQRSNALELSKVKSEFLASMSHELRTPLNSILGLTELVIKDKSTLLKNKERLGVVLRNGKRLLTLINNILEFSKIESGKTEIKKENFILQNFIKEIKSFIDPLLVDKPIDFNVNYKDSYELLVNTDRNKLEQILVNLLGNAVKFTDEGSVDINLSIKNRYDVEFEIADTGIGISEENKKIIFDEFRQGDGSTSRRHNGTGLGLAICRKYVALLGGKIEFDSIEGAGSKFSVTLENIITDKIEIIPEVDELQLEGGVSKKSEKKKILIVNSDKEVRKLIAAYLKSNNFNVFESATIAKGLQSSNDIHPDGIALDLNLTDGNGWDLYAKLNDANSTTNIPIVFTALLNSKRILPGFGIFENIHSPFENGMVKTTLEKISSLTKQPTSKVIFVTNNKETINNELHNSFLNSELIYFENDGLVRINNYSNKADLIVVDNILEDFRFLIKQIKLNQHLNNLPILFSSEEKLPENIAQDFYEILNEITKSSKHHPMDTLKILKDEFKISENNELKEKLIVEEINENTEVVITEKSDQKISEAPKILVVDDDNDTLFTVGEIVRSLGCQTLFARNGVECLKSLNTVRPDLILLDIMMPQMDGFETIQKIRENESLKDLPVLALTAHAMLEEKGVIEKNGFTGIVTKPINTATLAFRIQRVLKNNNQSVEYEKDTSS